MNFDAIGPWYEKVEWLVYGKRLQRTRTAHISFCEQSLDPTSKVLVIGDGDGRFFRELLTLCPDCSYTYVEHSSVMLELAQSRVTKAVKCTSVEWVYGDARRVVDREFDLVVTHFLLDCYNGEEREDMIETVTHWVKPSGYLLISDFDPHVGWWAMCWVKVMYIFFFLVAKLAVVSLERPDISIARQGLMKIREFTMMKGFIFSDVWHKKEK